MAEHAPDLPHLLVEGRTKTESYRPELGRGGSKVPSRDRAAHGRKLITALDRALALARQREDERRARGVSTGRGVVLEFASTPAFELALTSLENRQQGIELLAVRDGGGLQRAVVYVPEESVAHFNKILTDYLGPDTKKGKPKNDRLVRSINEIRLAVLESFWTDDPALLPRDDQAIWWEVWLRRESADAAPAELARFQREAHDLGVRVASSSLPFPDRIVTLALGSLTQLASCTELLGSVAELRRAKQTPAEFLRLEPREEAEWVRDLLARTTAPPQHAPAVCLLDTGVDRNHVLLNPAVRAEDLHSVVPDWGTSDHDGHGTEMAGLAIYGDLAPLLASRDPVALSHGLESVKLLPPRGANDPGLYGALTGEAIGRAETTAPDRLRVSCTTITTDDRDRGSPSSWSAAIDDLAAGTLDGERRLLVVAAGNAKPAGFTSYPSSNETDGVQDPGQSWNALTIGAFTEKARIEDQDYAEWSPLARPGDLSPWGTTSLTWEASWPVKPDIVLEGANLAIDPPRRETIDVPSLQLLSTARTTGGFGERRLLAPTNGTSAATALAARMAAIVRGTYPALWPETVRALLVHSAEWTPAMRQRYLTTPHRHRKRTLVRCCGFGVPNLGRALWSARNSLTLLVQESITPFGLDENRRKNMREMHIHPLPWPREELAKLGATQVEMKVTLSYFIEPSPGRRGWRYRHRYASHGLRFEVKTPEEKLEQFRWRLNRKAREEEDGRKGTGEDRDQWFLGPDICTLGSLHSDTWSGSAAKLAERGLIGIYPVIGWWRERQDLGKLDRSARYALVVSIRTPAQVLGVDVNVYAPVATQLAAEVEIEDGGE